MVDPQNNPWIRPRFIGAAALAGRHVCDLFLARRCAGCQQAFGPGESVPAGLCGSCFDALPGLSAARCPACAARSTAPEDHAAPDHERGPAHAAALRPCASCRRRPLALAACVTLADYAMPLDGMIARYKFGGDLSLAAVFASALAHRLTGSGNRSSAADAPARPTPLALVAVPLSDARLRARGFDQAGMLARQLARRLGVPVEHGVLRRVRETPDQIGRRHHERWTNLADAFAATRPIEGGTIGLVDDVMTTGATLDASARALLAAGAASVVGIVVARTPAPGSTASAGHNPADRNEHSPDRTQPMAPRTPAPRP